MQSGFLDLPVIIQVHTFAACAALLIGPVAIWRSRRDWLHRACGRIWVALMLLVAVSALFINEIRLIGPFSPIHLFSLLVFRSLFVAIRHVRAGRLREHGAEMRSLYLQALGLAGVFTLLPGRVMNRLIFGDNTVLALGVMGLIIAALAVLLRRRPRLVVLR